MDFSIPKKTQEVLDRVRHFINEEAIPLEHDFLNLGFGAILDRLKEKRRRVKELGLWLPQIEKQWGGMGLTLVEHGLVSAELGRCPIGHYLFNCQAPDAGNMEILIQFGTPEQQERFLKPLLAGETRSCFSMTEPEYPGSNPVWMNTTAVKDGDDYLINGHKWFTSAAEGSAFAVVMAVTDPDAPTHARASQILVPMETPGVEIVCNTSVMGHRGEDWHSHAEVRYTNVRVPQKNLLGEEGAGFAIAQERLGPGRIHHCMRWLGICERAFELLCEYSAHRETAPGKPLGANQFIQGFIAESRAEIDSARLMVLHAAWSIQEIGAKESRDQVSLIKFHVANVLMRVLDRAIQAHGALGMTDDTPLAYWFRNERAGRIYDGPDEVHKLVVAKRILKRYGIQVRSGGD